MKYTFWNQYSFISYDLILKLDIRLQNVVSTLERFFKNTTTSELTDEKIEFYLAGSCIKSDTFRDIDIFFLTKDKFNEINQSIDKKYFMYENNSSSYIYDNEIIQIVYRERFLNKNLSFVVDVFDFHSTKIGFKCVLDRNFFDIKIIESDIREEFIKYLHTSVNKLVNVNINPFVSLQRAIHFLKRGDDVPFSVFLNIILKISQIDENDNIEKYFDRLQGDNEELHEIRKSIKNYMTKKRNLSV
ncbi:hypothetical protein [Arcobacter sp. LA11]|uniref:hypothetical protein n=1 Tax=Arcobacter sp. LA11 TaxID=1898176 RepID=UPI0009342117|nr:hypothetical protein [Arcobacter sp. LA11]